GGVEVGGGVPGRRAGDEPAVVRRRRDAGAVVHAVLLLAAQPDALPEPVRPPAAGLVLPADRPRRPAARHGPAVGVREVPGERRGGDGVAAGAGAGLLPAGRRLVRAVLLAVGEQVADVRAAGVPGAVPGARLLRRPQPLAPVPGDLPRGGDDG